MNTDTDTDDTTETETEPLGLMVRLDALVASGQPP